MHRLSNLLGHPVEVQSQVGRGSCFSVSLPLAGEHAPAVMTLPADEHADVVGAVVVGIDDETDIREALELLLTGWGYDAVVAGSAVEAIAKLEQERKRPELVVADYRLKLGHTGADAILAIRHVWGGDVPGFLLTGDTGPDRLREAAASGFEVMHKPIQPEKLRLMVAETITRSRRVAAETAKVRAREKDEFERRA